jgi:large subunit ribosomal protein L21
MFAVIETGGKQYRVKTGDELLVELFDHGLPAARPPDGQGQAGKSKTLKLDKVLLLSADNGVEVGRPFVKGAYCEAELLAETKGPKVISFKYIRREKSATKVGHRQKYLKLKIKSIHKGA